ncbi:hypothetical protein [Serratia rubidaea]|uniref:hypothetical protein n=1 Tax=Serratia rubidaea TaxID=61652 RepID=UPI00177C50CE|nr:hypothetical protein [Serratia rubidaea]MBD8451889.1 hypothetical protein [Serratia rubidaea]
MRYRKEDENGDYCFGRSDGDFYVNTPDAPALAVKTRLMLREGEWFLDANEGTDWRQILGKYTPFYDAIIRERILGTPGVTELVEYNSNRNSDARTLDVTATITTAYGKTTVTANV